MPTTLWKQFWSWTHPQKPFHETIPMEPCNFTHLAFSSMNPSPYSTVVRLVGWIHTSQSCGGGLRKGGM